MIVNMNKKQGDKNDILLSCAVGSLCITIFVVAFSMGQNVGSANAYKEMEKRIEVIVTLHKQDSIIQKLRKETQNEP
jgi:hypothetical protein